MSKEDTNYLNKVDDKAGAGVDGIDVENTTKNLKSTAAKKPAFKVNPLDVIFLMKELLIEDVDAKNLLRENNGDLDKIVENYILGK